MTSNIPKVMRAVVCPSVPIPPSGLIYSTTHPAPSPKSGHVLIRVKAFGLNRSELFTRQGHSPGIVFPRVLGIECVGEVQDVGGEGGMWKEGDTVAAIMGGMGRQFDGGYAEYTLVPRSAVSPPIKLPKSVSWAHFAAIPETFMTAWSALKDALKLSANDTLLIRGGTTSVGMAAATLAKIHFSCHRVISTTRSAKKTDALKVAGVDDIIIDSGKIADEVMRITDGKGVDRCIELVGGTTMSDSCLSLAPNGIVAYVGCVSGEWIIKEFDPGMCLSPHKSMTFATGGSVDFNEAPLQALVDDIDRGELKLGLDKIFKMEDAGKAHEYMESNAASGKVVCVVD